MARPLTIRAPLTGIVVALADVPDQVFATSMVGPGLAIDPDPDEPAVLAPVSGVLAACHPHAFVVQSGDRGVLVHLGIETVGLDGVGFTADARAGDPVQVGASVIRWDPRAVTGSGRSTLCPVVAVQASPETVTTLVLPGARVRAGDALMDWA